MSLSIVENANRWLRKRQSLVAKTPIVSRRVFDSFSLVSRSTFVALSFVFRLFLVRSSFGLR